MIIADTKSSNKIINFLIVQIREKILIYINIIINISLE